MNDRTCGLSEYIFPRDLENLGFFIDNGSVADTPGTLTDERGLEKRFSPKGLKAIEKVLYGIAFQLVGNAVYEEIWKKHVESEFSHMKSSNIRTFLQTSTEWISRGKAAIVNEIACGLTFYNSKFGNDKHLSCKCDTADCCDDQESCSDDDDEDWDVSDASKRSLEKRSARSYDVNLQDNRRPVQVTTWAYMERRNIQPNDPILGEGYEYDNQDNCLNTQAGIVQIPLSNIQTYEVEHVVELVTPALFLRDAALGDLPSGSGSMTGGPISSTFVRQALMAPILNNPPIMTGGDQSTTPMMRVTHVLGSLNNRADFNLLLKSLNKFKHRFWAGKTLHGDDKMDKEIKAKNPKKALNYMRECLTIITYLNHFRVQPGLVRTLNAMRTEFGRADTWWVNNGNTNQHTQARWDHGFVISWTMTPTGCETLSNIGPKRCANIGEFEPVSKPTKSSRFSRLSGGRLTLRELITTVLIEMVSKNGKYKWNNVDNPR